MIEQPVEIHLGAPAADWDEFVLASPAAGPFHLAAWQELYRQVYGLRPLALTARQGGAVVGVLPLCQVRAWPARPHLTSLPGGVCAASPAAAQALLDAAADLTRRLDVAFLALRDSPIPLPWPVETGPLTADAPHMARWRSIARHVVIRQRLQPDADALWRGFRHDLRNLIRRGQRAGFSLTWDAAQLDTWYPAFAENSQRKGTPALSRRFLQQAAARFPDRFTLLTLHQGDALVGGGCQFLLGQTVWCTWGAVRPAFLRQHASYLFYWEILAHFAGGAWAVVDFGRSAAGSGQAAFKRQFSFGQEQPLYQHVWLHRQTRLPALIAQAQPAGALGWAQRLWQRLPPAAAERLSDLVRRRTPFG